MPIQTRRWQCRTRTLMLAVLVIGVWLGILLDPNLSPLVLFVIGGLGIGLTVMGAAMALGFLGFGLFAVGDRLVAWLRRAAQWPDEGISD